MASGAPGTPAKRWCPWYPCKAVVPLVPRLTLGVPEEEKRKKKKIRKAGPRKFFFRAPGIPNFFFFIFKFFIYFFCCCFFSLSKRPCSAGTSRLGRSFHSWRPRCPSHSLARREALYSPSTDLSFFFFFPPCPWYPGFRAGRSCRGWRGPGARALSCQTQKLGSRDDFQ